MQFNARFLKAPTCVFAGDVAYAGADVRFRGVKTHGPYDSTGVTAEPHTLFVFPEEFKDLANDLFAGLKNGNSQFPGLQAMFGIRLTKDAVARCTQFHVQNMDVSAAADKYATAIASAIGPSDAYDFAFVLVDKTAYVEHPSPYYTAKALLAAHGIPSQVVSTDVLRNKTQLTWSLSNIALQMFVKLEGCPWFVKPFSGGGDIVIGIGKSERTDKSGRTVRFVGYTTAYTAGGVFKSVELFTPQGTLDDYLASFGDSIYAALSKVVVGSNPVRLVLHVPKKFSRDERNHLEAALKRLSVQRSWIYGTTPQ